MFTWICPQCGREVPPSYTECPDCAAKEKVPVSPAAEPAQPPANMPPGSEVPPQPPYGPQQPQAAPPPYVPQQYAYPQYPPQYAPPQGQYPQYPQYPPHQYQPPPQYPAPAAPYAPPPARKGLQALPTWLLTAVFALAFVAVVGGVYTLVGRSTSASPAATVENPAAKPGAKTSPLQKYIEVSGIRFTEDKKRDILVKFTLTNHSDADLSGLAGNVTVWGRTQKSEEDAVGTFAFKTNVPPQTSEEVTAPLVTKLKIYELPDWQNVTTDVQITSPQ
jgi:hypothetical protein